MSFLDNLENNLKSLESSEEADAADARRRESDQRQRKAAGPWAERLRNGEFSKKLMQQATRAGKPLDLTRTEFLILQVLMRRPGTVITRAYLADHVWQQDANSIDSIIDVHISNLRRKLDVGRTKSLLQTLRGRGYRLTADE